MFSNKAVRDARALTVFLRRVNGEKVKDIALSMGISKETAGDDIKRAEKMDIIKQYQERILNQLVPKAIDAVQKALENNDTQAAFEVLKGSNLLLKPSERPKQLEEEDLYDLDRYRLLRRQGAIDGERVPQGLPAAETPGVVDGSTIEDSTAGSEEAAPAMGSSGDESGFQKSE